MSALIYPNLICLDRKLLSLKHLFTKIRNRETNHVEFARYSRRIMNVLCEEGLATLSPKSIEITTPTGSTFVGEEVDSSSVVAISIIRAGDSLLDAFLSIVPECSVGKILIQRNEETAEPQLYYSKLPSLEKYEDDIRPSPRSFNVESLSHITEMEQNASSSSSSPDVSPSTSPVVDNSSPLTSRQHRKKKQEIVILDPMLATGGSVLMAIRLIVSKGVPPSHITFLNVIACPEGIRNVFSEFPEIRIVTGCIDDGLNEKKYIIPGVGDFGDRFFGTC